MPTISQLPAATAAGAQDELPISQSGITRSINVSQLLAGTQPAIEIASGSLLGRVSLGPGGPEPVAVGVGLAVNGGDLAANGGDHSGFPLLSALNPSDQAVINSNGTPTRLPLALLTGLFTAGSNIGISADGTISASTDPGVTSELSSLQAGLTATETSVGSITSLLSSGSFVTTNSQGEVTAPIAGPVTLGTVQVAAGAPSRSIGARALDVINVVDFGASTSSADNSAAFNLAFAALPASGGEVFIPSGDFILTSGIVLPSKALVIRGAGKGVTRLHFRHTGIGFDCTQTTSFNKVVFRDFSAYAESAAGQTAAVARLTYPAQVSFGYVTSYIANVECFSYPNAQNGTAPFPQTFLRGFILNNCWSTQADNISWFGPPSAAGATSSALFELNGSIDTRITGVQAYYGHAVVLQTGYCEGIYFTNPLVVGTDYLFTQTDITTWPTYAPGKLVLLGLWASNGEVNTNLGTVRASAVGGGFFVGLDITRDGGPATAQSFFSFTDVSNFSVVACSFNGGPSAGQDIAFNFSSTFNSSHNTIAGCQFGNMATAILINNGNGTVALTAFGLNVGTMPLNTAFIDNSNSSVDNLITFQTTASGSTPAATASTKDHIFASADGSPVLRLSNVLGASNYVTLTAATSSNPPTIAFDGSDGTVNGVIQTKGGNLFVNASGGTSESGNMLSLENIDGAVCWPVMQNATSGNLCSLSTNAGGLSVGAVGSLWLSPGAGLFASGLPTTRPAVGSKQVWNNAGTLCIA